MLKIRLARFGKKKKPTYRFIVSDSKKDTLGTYLENLGYYNPHAKVCEVKKDRVLYWVGVGAQMSPTVHNLLVDQKIIDKQKVKAFTPKKKEGGEEATTPAPAEASEKPAEATEAPAEESKDAAPAEEPKKEEAPAEEKTEEVKEEPVAEEKPAEPAPAEESKKESQEETPAEEKTEEDKKEQ